MSGYRDLPAWQRGTEQQRRDIEVAWNRMPMVEPLWVRQFFASMAPFTEALRRDMETLPGRLNAALPARRER